MLRPFSLPFSFWACFQCAIRVPQSLLDRYDCGILVATLHTRPPRLRHLNHNDAYVTTTIAAFQSQQQILDRPDMASNRHDAYLFATIAAAQPPQRVVECFDVSIPIAAADTRPPRLWPSNRHDTYSATPIAAIQSPQRVLARHDRSVAIATTYARLPRYDISIVLMRNQAFRRFRFCYVLRLSPAQRPAAKLRRIDRPGIHSLDSRFQNGPDLARRKAASV